jgi:hypothetical protein
VKIVSVSNIDRYSGGCIGQSRRCLWFSKGEDAALHGGERDHQDDRDAKQFPHGGVPSGTM